MRTPSAAGAEPVPAARYQFPELTRREAEVRQQRAAEPSDLADEHRIQAWTERMEQVGAEWRRLYDVLGPLLCGRCSGTGLTSCRHRHGGVCYQCKGDGWSRRGRRLVKTWGELPEHDRGTLVRFFRTAELESSFDYAAEHFPPDFPESSTLHHIGPTALRARYWEAYKSLSLNEFWRLYNLV